MYAAVSCALTRLPVRSSKEELFKVVFLQPKWLAVQEPPKEEEVWVRACVCFTSLNGVAFVAVSLILGLCRR